jgi:DNA-binding Lrp family transcriptional regulator
LDHRILGLLVRDGRRSASEIGRLINLSPAAAKRRIDRLEGAGYSRGHTATLSPLARYERAPFPAAHGVATGSGGRWFMIGSER